MKWNLMIFKDVTIWIKRALWQLNLNLASKNAAFLSTERTSVIISFLTQLNFSGRLFVSESICHKNHQLSHNCRQLKNTGKIHSNWIWNNSINVKLNERSQPTKIHHVIDIEKLLGVDNLDKFINDTSF